MNLPEIISQLLGKFWWLLAALLALTVAKAALQIPAIKGALGEWLLALSIKLKQPKDRYKAFHNLILPTPDGTTQVDHVIVSRFGIFVVETKTMSGWIFGSEHQPRWTQNIYGKSYPFQNPLRQNYKHVKALEALLGISATEIHSVVVFLGSCEFRSQMPENVMFGGDFANYVKHFSSQVFTEHELSEIIEKTSRSVASRTPNVQHEHVARLKARSDPEHSRQCPRCGNAMAIRTAKRGSSAGNQFWGCSGYPSCRATQPID